MYYAATFNGGIDHPISNPDPYLYLERIESWGPTLCRDLAPLLHSNSGMRDAAIATYPLHAPLGNKPLYSQTPKDWELMILSVKPIYDEERVWFLAHMNSHSFELDNPRSSGFFEIRNNCALARSRAEYTDHPYLPDHPLVKIKFELRIDFNVPFWLVDQVIRVVNERSTVAGEQHFAYLDVTVSEEGSHEERGLLTTSLPPPPDAHVITLLPHTAFNPAADVDVLVDGLSAITVSGPLNSRIRHDGIARAIEQGLDTASPRRNAVCVRGGPLTPWGDVVAGLDGAQIANNMTGDEWRTEGTEDPTMRKSLTIAPMFTGKTSKNPMTTEAPPGAQPSSAAAGQ